MNDDAIGRTLRAIRQRLGLRQADVAARAGLSQQVVSALERGGLEQLSLRAARGVARALGAELVVGVRWRGAEIDRVRDEDHARVVAETAALLEAEGWLTATEVTYSWYGERGSNRPARVPPGDTDVARGGGQDGDRVRGGDAAPARR